jgi:hypothetical protein
LVLAHSGPGRADNWASIEICVFEHCARGGLLSF